MLLFTFLRHEQIVFLLVSGFGKCFVGAEENLSIVHRRSRLSALICAQLLCVMFDHSRMCLFNKTHL